VSTCQRKNMVKIIYSKKCLGYREPGHPESPERVGNSYYLLRDKGFEFIEPQPCSEQDLLLVHSAEMIESVKENTFRDGDTPNFPGIYDIAKLSAGGAIRAGELALEGEGSFSLMRPPGHHATRDMVYGFCYFNNMAIAVKKTLKADPGKRIAIIDIDCHHGNGTEGIFLGEKRIVYLSLHQSPLFPGTGLGPQRNCIDFPLSAGTGEEEYLKALAAGLEEVKKFDPSLVAVSAGFDTYEKDPISDMDLKQETYRKISGLIKDLGRPVFSVLEGGYSPDLPHCIYQYLLGIE